MCTPGEWTVEVGDDETTVEAKSQTICTNVSNCDAQLIATAPRMAELIKDIVKRAGWVDQEHFVEARAILKTIGLS